MLVVDNQISSEDQEKKDKFRNWWIHLATWRYAISKEGQKSGCVCMYTFIINFFP